MSDTTVQPSGASDATTPTGPTLSDVLSQFPIDEFLISHAEVVAILDIIGDMPAHEVAGSKPHMLALRLHTFVSTLRAAAAEADSRIKKNPTTFVPPINMQRAGINAGIIIKHLPTALELYESMGSGVS